MEATKKSVFFGTLKETGEDIYLTYPTWGYGWYWSFGYLGNRSCHFHLCSYANGRNINMYDALLEDYELSENIKKNLWAFCELSKTAYTLKDAAEILGRGGSNYSNNPCRDIIMNSDEVKRINEVVLPSIFDKIRDITG